MTSKRIPLVKNQIDESAGSGVNFLTLTMIAAAAALMVFYVWMQIRIGDALRENLWLDAELRRLQIEQQKLEADVTRLSSYDRVTKIAREQLGMVEIPRENIKTLQK